MDRLKSVSEMKIAEESRVRARSLARNTFGGGVEGHAGAPRWD